MQTNNKAKPRGWLSPGRGFKARASGGYCGCAVGKSKAGAAFHLGRAHGLYKALFGQIEDLTAGQQLLFEPSEPLVGLPFHVLVTKKPEKD